MEALRKRGISEGLTERVVEIVMETRSRVRVRGSGEMVLDG